MSLLGIDVGTSSVKACVIAEAGEVLAAAHRGYAASFPAPGRMELDPSVVVGTFHGVVREVVAAPRVRRDPVTALALSVSCDEVVPVDARGQPIGPCIMAPDTRGSDAVERIRAAIDEGEAFRRTGLPISSIHPLARVIWYQLHQPDLVGSTERWLGWAELILESLDLPAVTDETTAARWLAWDTRAGDWWEEALEVAGLVRTALPGVVSPGTPIGRLARGAAERTGLRVGTVVVGGAFDQLCAGLGAGLSQPGDCAVSSGTWENATVLLREPPAPEALERGITWGPFPGGRTYALLMNPSGLSAVRWFADNVVGEAAREAARGQDDPYGALIAGASRSPAQVYFVPHLQGSFAPWRDPNARGAFVGLTLASTHEEMLRAVLEGTAFELRLNLEPIAGGPPLRDPIRNCGGGARAPLWVQIKADILGRPIAKIDVDEPGCAGAAILAGAGTGVFSDVSQGQRAICRPGEVVEPDPANSALYDARFETYRRLYPALHAALRDEETHPAPGGRFDA